MAMSLSRTHLSHITPALWFASWAAMSRESLAEKGREGMTGFSLPLSLPLTLLLSSPPSSSLVSSKGEGWRGDVETKERPSEAPRPPCKLSFGLLVGDWEGTGGTERGREKEGGERLRERWP